MSDFIICPYPGLRPFNEDEAIFFKGREEHIEQIIKQLEEKKFLMLTGASGDGKSSLVYAGVIPNARAGFFKAKFNNWIIADFRPEREPLKNFATALCNQLKISDVAKTEKELSYGFSALIDLYKSSPYWVDQNSEEFKSLAEADQKKAKRKGANLMILVDQFEEFFTNPENYSNGRSSVESQTVVNLLLETTKLAIEQDIPVYIICTMRSDYIGQCASFRGLPEYIGYSQFFVPRLKRKEIYQVIEEPALLNGNKISKRLVEMLINEMNDGIDQLPVLQHALNQVWQMADKGSAEMDIIHFAKISGVPKAQLSTKDKAEFESWFEELPEFKKQYFEEASLENVLDAHANELYENAAKFVNEKYKEEKISSEDAKLIVQVAFKCLTKIDEARAVRNRMTLEEVTHIINQPHLNKSIVADVLEVYRKQGNTFLKPFITDDTNSLQLNSNSVLDITHESLIRNWKRLTEWAKEEHDSLLTYQDFNKQLQRWLASGKSSGYLLPIGPLTFFENWFNTAKPNKYWLARYDERDISKEEKLKDAEKTLAEINSFIKRSARRLFFSRTVIKYGADNLIAVFGLLLLLFSCTYFYFDFRKKQNDYVVNELIERGHGLLHSVKVKKTVKAHFLINHERLFPGSTEKNLNSLHNDTLAYDLAATYFSLIQNYNEKNVPTHKMAHRLLMYMDSTLNTMIANGENGIYNNIKRITNHVRLCSFIYFHKGTEASKSLLDKNLIHIQKYLFNGLDNPSKINPEQYNLAIDLWLALAQVDSNNIHSLLDKISPFTDKGIKTFNTIYPRDQKTKVDGEHYIMHKGGYQIIAGLYAAIGNYDLLNRALDTLYNTNPEYDKFWYYGIFDIENILLKFQKVPSAEFEKIAELFYKKFPSELNVNNWYKTLAYSQMEKKMNAISFIEDQTKEIHSNILLYFIPEEKKEVLFSQYCEILKRNYSQPEEKTINEALFLKKLGVYFYERRNDTLLGKKYFYQALNLFKGLTKEFLNKNYIFYDYRNKPITDGEKISNTMAFCLPSPIKLDSWDMFGVNYWECDESGCFPTVLDKELPFLKFLVSNHLDNYVVSEADLKILERYAYAFFGSIGREKKYSDNLIYENFERIVRLIKGRDKEKKLLNENFLQLVKLRKALSDKDSVKALEAFLSINMKEVLDVSFQKSDSKKDYIHTGLLKDLYIYLAMSNKPGEAFQVLKVFSDSWERRNCLIDASFKLVEMDKVSSAFVYIDSLLPQLKIKPKFGMKLYRVLGKIGGENTYKAALGIFKDMDDKLKPRALQNFIWGISHNELYYTAVTYIPSTVSRVNEMGLYNEILHAQVELLLKVNRQTDEAQNWSFYDQRYYGEFIPQNYEVEGEHFDRFSD